METFANNKTRVSIKPPQLLICPKCSFRMQADSNECPACGIIISKYLDYVPSKALNESALTINEISSIRKIKDKLQNSSAKKQFFEILLHCNKEGLLDLAAYHIRDSKEENGQIALKSLLNRYSLIPFSIKQRNFLNWLTRPLVLLFLLVLSGLVALTIFLRLFTY